MAITAFPYTAVLDVSANSLLGNNTGSPAAAIALTATQVRTLLSVYTSAQVDALLAGYQPLDSDLTAIAALTTTSFGRSLLTQADAAATRTTIDAVPTARTLTINGTTQDLSADRTFTVSAGISSLNGLTGATQTFAVDTTGTDVAFSSAAGVHTLNIPSASATARGVVTTGTQTFAGGKTFSANLTCLNIVSGYQIAANASRCSIFNNFNAGGGFGYGFTVSTGINDPSSILAPTAADSANIGKIRLRYGTTACGFFVCNTYTSTTSYEQLEINWSGNVCTIETSKGSAGGTLRGLKIGGASTSLLGFYGATPVDRPDTVADPTGGSTIDAEARTAINTIIDRLQELGLIA